MSSGTFISLVKEEKQQGEIMQSLQKESTLPLYDMVTEFLVGVSAW